MQLFGILGKNIQINELPGPSVYIFDIFKDANACYSQIIADLFVVDENHMQTILVFITY